MNFKPSLWKSIISIIGGVIVGYSVDRLINNRIIAYDEGSMLPTTLLIPLGRMILAFICAMIFIYLLWSLIQKKR
mgnify:CR=1 FL=1